MPSMATLAGEVSVFADTNLGTRIAFNVPQDITAGSFKRDFERVHFLILPNSGKIQVNGLMDLMNSNGDDKARGNSEDNTVHILQERKKRKRIKFNKKHLQNAASATPEGCFCKLEERPKGINNKSAVAMPENEVQISVNLIPLQETLREFTS